MSEPQAMLDYARATAGNSTRGRVWSGVAVCIAGLGLIVLGGCFLIGVMLIVTQGFATAKLSASLGPAAITLMVILYLLAGVSFVGAATVLFLGIRELLRVMRSP